MSKLSVSPLTDGDARDISDMYQSKTDKEHILDNPETYTGPMRKSLIEEFVYNDSMIIRKSVEYVPGLLKLFDEAAMNARDQHERMKQLITTDSTCDKKCLVSEINVTISDDGTITIFNNGNGIDIVKHPIHNIWVPELIFANLRTSTNYKTTEKKIVGGKNGFGIKLAFIWSTWGSIETIDYKRGLKYTQVFENNLNIINPPTITKYTKKPYTSVSFKPDFKRMGITDINSDMISLIKRRVFDLAAVTNKSVSVKFNDIVVPVKTFIQYALLYINPEHQKNIVYEECNARWECVVATPPPSGEFTQISFVNGIYTSKGGKHVDYIVNQLIRKMIIYIKLKTKIDVKPNTIKEQLFIFIRCDIENPSFDSQSKDFMSTNVTDFGSTCDLSDKFVEKVAKLGIMEHACALTQVKILKVIQKQDGIKSKHIRGIPKLTDANLAGGQYSTKCILILCEGDSAKTSIISGLSTSDRDIIGVYPLRGKLFNVRGETASRIADVVEIREIKQIMGLEANKTYTIEDVGKHLRYSRLVIMTDQDLDGSHIKGLCINLFDVLWPSLMTIPGFLGFMNTPIIKAHKGLQNISFYSEGEYDLWKTKTELRGWDFKYYKGLGSSTSKEFKEYFITKRFVSLNQTNECCGSIDKVFNKKRADDRKSWLGLYNRLRILDTSKQTISLTEFVDNEMIHFSKYACERAIPNCIDGFKTSQRKVMHTCFGRNIKTEIKVSQLGGAVSETTHYHHGEQSLMSTIIGMAQDFVGSNNINLLDPCGQFGSRLKGGHDAASERYVHTKLNYLTRLIFPVEDDAVLKYNTDDGVDVEPIFYVPIIPMQLVNGGQGIGTGYSTFIPNFNPILIIQYLLDMLKLCKDGKSIDSRLELNPFYKGFTGEISKINDSKFVIKGKYEINENTVRITELPIGIWTDDYKVMLDGLICEGCRNSSDSVIPTIKSVVDMSTDTIIDISVKFAKDVTAFSSKPSEISGCNMLEKFLGLYNTCSTKNMHAFDENEHLNKYNNVGEIMDKFILVRREYYVKRIALQIEKLEREYIIMSNRARFITEIITDKIDLRKKSSKEVHELLTVNNYASDADGSFKYLTQMPIDSVTLENNIRMNEELVNKRNKIVELQTRSVDDTWSSELETLHSAYLNCSNTTIKMSKTTIKPPIKTHKKQNNR